MGKDRIDLRDLLGYTRPEVIGVHDERCVLIGGDRDGDETGRKRVKGYSQTNWLVIEEGDDELWAYSVKVENELYKLLKVLNPITVENVIPLERGLSELFIIYRGVKYEGYKLRHRLPEVVSQKELDELMSDKGAAYDDEVYGPRYDEFSENQL